MAHLRIQLLGHPEIAHGGAPISLRTRKALALLIYLVVEGGVHTRDHLAALLWPESEASAARATLRSTLRYLRRPLDHGGDVPPPHLDVTRTTLAFNFASDHRLDLAQVEAAVESEEATLRRLKAAAALIRGAFLEGFSLPDAPAFADWASFQREHWHLRASGLLARLAHAQSQSGETTAAIETARRRTALDPLQEDAQQQLMRLQLAAGDRPGALQSYRRCRELLVEELGVEPAPETKALLARVEAPGEQKGRPTAATAPQGAPATPAQLGGAIQTRRPPLPFVGRREEHRRLAEAYYRTASGKAATVMLEGEAGIGKSRLAREFLSWAAAQGATVLRGRGFETGGRLPYQPLVDAFRPVAADLPGLLSPTWLGELARLLPELYDLMPELPPPTGDEKLGRSRLFEALARLGTALADRQQAPHVLFMDDLQWADAATLEAINYCARRWDTAGAAVLFLGAVRAEALHRATASETLLQFLRDLERAPGMLRLQLEALTQAEVADFVEQAMEPAAADAKATAFRRWLFRETGGQPFYLTETIKALLEEGVLVTHPGEDGRIALPSRQAPFASGAQNGAPVDFVPPGVREVVRRRLARLEQPAFDLLVAGAVLGQEFSFARLCRVAALSTREGLSALEALLAANLLTETGQTAQPYTFAHDKIRDVVYTAAGDARRRLFHERALAVLVDAHASAAQLAHHAHAAGAYRETFGYSVQAGDDALALFAAREAAYHYEDAREILQQAPAVAEALSMQDRRALYEHLGRAYELVNEWDNALEIYQEMLAAARDAGSVSVEVAALNRMATAKLLAQMDIDAALALLDKARPRAEAAGDTAGLAETEWNLCLAHFYSFRRPTALEHGERAVALAREVGDRELIARCLNAAGYAATGVNLWEKVVQYGQDARNLYAKEGGRALEADSLLLVAFARINIGEAAAGVEAAREALAICQEIDNQWGEANSRNSLAAGLLDLGQYGEALAVIEKSLELEQIREAPQYMAALTVHGMVHRALLDFERCLADHQEAADLLGRIGPAAIGRVLSAHLCADHAYLGQWEEAYPHAQMAMETKDFAWYYAGFHYWTVVEALCHGGDAALAEADIVALDEAVGRFPRYQLIIARSRAAISHWQEETPAAIGHLEEALETAKALQLPGEQWPILALLAALHQTVGHEQQAERARSEAVAVVHRLADTIAEEATRTDFVDSALQHVYDEQPRDETAL
ncbi:MAG: AAA family ATPase [Candidatus Promineifilaceae bacterium]|nr:AAA family ATPase [Candidatus Promineifilaceae bacterium]